ncbi:hypothetical protein [Streptomyces sp. NPDC001260]|uniref:hypothetical protein n=1 Tax=Streptomyces sp. NPDC001260 TaxID=3364551 RepID=UPI0036CE9B41
MTQYDCLAGIDEPTLNQIVAAVYGIVHKDLLTGTVEPKVPGLGVTAIDYDVSAVPTVTLRPSDLVARTQRALLAERHATDPDAMDRAVRLASRGSFDLTVAQLALTLHYAGNQPVTSLDCVLHAGLDLRLDGQILTPRVVGLTVEVPGDPRLSQIITQGLLPLLQDVANAHLRSVTLPPLVLGTLRAAPPVVVTGEGRLLVTTALEPAASEPAPVIGNWPRNAAFLGLDAKPAAAVILAVCENKGDIAGNWSKTYRLSFFARTTLKADYALHVRKLDLAVVPECPGQLRGDAELDIRVHFHAKNLGSCTVKGSARPKARVTMSVTGANEIAVKFDALDDIAVDLDFHNVPPWLDRALSHDINALRAQIAHQATTALVGRRPETVAQFPEVVIPYPGGRVVARLGGTSLIVVESPDGRLLLTAQGRPEVVAG